MKAVTADQMRAIDRAAIEERGMAGYDLMKAAGAAIARAVFDYLDGDRVLVLCGRGNNGGDGWVVARLLRESGIAVDALAPLGTEGLAGDALRAFEDFRAAGGEPVESIGDLDALLARADLVVDALLGTGSKLPLRAPLDEVVRRVGASGLPVIAADIPTGLDADTGEGPGAMRCACTVAIGLPKVGMLSADGRRACGVVRIEPIQFPRDLLEDPAIRRETLAPAEAAALLPARPVDGHKGTFGTATIIAGSRWTPGAALLAAEGALRSGAGLVRVQGGGSVRQAVLAALPECLLSPWSESVGADEEPAPVGAGAMRALLDASDALVVGPGIGTSPSAEGFVGALLEARAARRERPPLVLDADALNLLAANPGWRGWLDGGVVMTPHPGEAARLLGLPGAAEVQRDRWGSAERLAETHGCIVLLKGFGSLVAEPGGRTAHCAPGNSALARGGSGDLLAGLVGGLAAQGIPAFDAARLGAFVHGMAADIAIREGSPRGLRLADAAACLPQAFRELERSLPRDSHSA